MQCEVLSVQLQESFNQLFAQTYTKQTLFGPDDLFQKHHIDSIIGNLDGCTTLAQLRKLIGGQTIPGQLEGLLETVIAFREGPLAEDTRLEMEREKSEKEAALAKAQEEEDKQAHKHAVKIEAERLAKLQEEERRQIEMELRMKRKKVEDSWKAKQAAHMAMLVRLAGEDAEMRGVKSIHHGR
ncbi:ATP-dependent DNA helicase sgs1 [Puccinia graminis f. sp. tritici]|uniref:ATP-dependent DNA helicase sgs1 n=1 Tax=Puccinia graminis f. sp. tritici TaxID=56615 RepID=A0A5B0RGP4_PUCGR|nr:ATP-dependent DNA helicase sgs1 [Puccinia graminis f. sp. tritici]